MQAPTADCGWNYAFARCCPRKKLWGQRGGLVLAGLKNKLTKGLTLSDTWFDPRGSPSLTLALVARVKLQAELG